MHAGRAIVDRARALGKTSIAVVGTAKNVGKTVTVTALADVLSLERDAFAVCTIGRDGERVDALEGTAKPCLFLRPGALLATAAALIPAHPAVEFLEATGERSALGEVVLVRVMAAGTFEGAGPAAASALRRVVARLFARGAVTVVIDGAVDRIAALREEDAVVVATGAASGPTPARVVAETARLVAALRTPALDPARPSVEVAGALTGAKAADLLRTGERRQVVVEDPTRIVASGRALAALGALEIRARHRLHPIACTIAPAGPGRSFEPRAFLREVADAVGLPCYDVYAGTAA